jgi:hypothetical protein
VPVAKQAGVQGVAPRTENQVRFSSSSKESPHVLDATAGGGAGGRPRTKKSAPRTENQVNFSSHQRNHLMCSTRPQAGVQGVAPRTIRRQAGVQGIDPRTKNSEFQLSSKESPQVPDATAGGGAGGRLRTEKSAPRTINQLRLCVPGLLRIGVGPPGRRRRSPRRRVCR